MIIDQMGRKWWKGNLHTHTTRSDGRKDPEEAIALYQEKGYDFLAITDHWRLSEKGQYKNMLLFSGTELDTNSAGNGIWHIVGIDLQKFPENVEKDSQPQEMINAICQAGGLAILAHPAWSLDEPDSMAKLTGLSGVEIYNSVSAFPYSARPDSSAVLDLAAVRGFNVPYMAADDTHYYELDATRSFIYVQAEHLDHDSIRAAIEDGRVYASQGPLASWKVENGIFSVDTDDAEQIIFYSGSVWQRDTCVKGPHVTHAEFKIKMDPSLGRGRKDIFVRAEIVNDRGQHAWTPAVFM